ALDGAQADAEPGERARPHPDREPPEVVHRPAGVAQESVHRDHEALGVGEAHVEQILADQDVAVEERDAAGECRGLYGEDAHTPSVAIKCDNAPGRHRMSATPRKDPVAVEAEVREKIHLEILKRTGAYHANDHVLLPSGQHTTEYIEKTLVTMEPSFTEGLGAVIAKHFAQWPVDVVLSTGPGALILSHCVARAHPSRPVVVYGTKGLSGGKRRVSLPVEFQRLIRPSSKVLLVEDLVSTGSTLNLLINLVEPRAYSTRPPTGPPPRRRSCRRRGSGRGSGSPGARSSRTARTPAPGRPRAGSSPAAASPTGSEARPSRSPGGRGTPPAPGRRA